MALALCRDIVSRKALAAGCVRESGTCPHRRLAPFRSEQVTLGVSPQFENPQKPRSREAATAIEVSRQADSHN